MPGDGNQSINLQVGWASILGGTRTRYNRKTCFVAGSLPPCGPRPPWHGPSQPVREAALGPHREQPIPNLQPSVFLGCAPFDDLGDVNAVVARDVLVPDAPRDAEAQPWKKEHGIGGGRPPFIRPTLTSSAVGRERRAEKGRAKWGRLSAWDLLLP